MSNESENVDFEADEDSTDALPVEKRHDHWMMVFLGLGLLVAAGILYVQVIDFPILGIIAAPLALAGAAAYVTGIVLWLLSWNKVNR